MGPTFYAEKIVSNWSFIIHMMFLSFFSISLPNSLIFFSLKFCVELLQFFSTGTFFQFRGGFTVQKKVVANCCKIDTIYIKVVALIFVVVAVVIIVIVNVAILFCFEVLVVTA